MGHPEQPTPPEEIIYVVIGTTGEYSDRGEWLTRAFASEGEAKAYVEFLGVERQKLAPLDVYLDYEDRQRVEQVMQAHDPGYQEDYTGTRWFVTPVALARSEGQ